MTSLRALLQQAIEDDARTTGRSKADIARAAGVHKTTLSQRREPDPATLAAVLDHLGRDVVLTPAASEIGRLKLIAEAWRDLAVARARRYEGPRDRASWDAALDVGVDAVGRLRALGVDVSAESLAILPTP